MSREEAGENLKDIETIEKSEAVALPHVSTSQVLSQEAENAQRMYQARL